MSIAAHSVLEAIYLEVLRQEMNWWREQYRYWRETLGLPIVGKPLIARAPS